MRGSLSIAFLIFSALFLGCKPTPSKLAHQIAGADRVVAKYYRPPNVPKFSAFCVTITGDDVRRIVKAISHSKGGHMDSLCMPSWELQFYKGTNHLADADFGCDLVWVDQVEFEDSSGILRKLDRALDAQSRRVPVPTSGVIGPLLSY